MIFFIEVTKSIIFLLFPILLYSFFENTNFEKDSNKILKISLLSSLILFTSFINNQYLSILINTLLLIAYIKKYYKMYLIMNSIIIVYLFAILNISLYILLLQYILLFIIMCFIKEKEKWFIIINTYFYTFIQFYNDNFNLLSKSFIKILIIIILNCILTKIIKYITIEYKNKYKKLEEEYRTYLFKFIHEVKNPISVCKGYIEIINTKNKKTNKKYLQIIDKQIDESLNIMDEYLTLGRFNVELDYIDITLLLEEIYNEFKFFMNENKIAFSYNNNDEEIIILGDYKKLKQVFKNIIKNSVEAKSKDRNLSIKIKLSINEKNVQIIIEDNGIGIKNLEKVGDKFYTTKKNGTGLGINFSKTIIALHNGNINYYSNELGTKVEIILPITMM